MSKKMLIDASHPEETRVVIVDRSQIEELDFESQKKRQIRGNVYLARVTRVEPSLQAAFVEYGGNRHGFLAFSEIHPDYYQIPFEDRMELLAAEEAENQVADDEDESDDADSPKASASAKGRGRKKTDEGEGSQSDDEGDEDEDNDTEGEDTESDDTESDDEDEVSNGEDADDADVADEQEKTASQRRKRMSRRRYKIQEVIKRGQILLIQAVKEERGNKGAAMTTYLSLAGRYCVLMPNTPRGGGISRKIANGTDRKRLKGIMSDLSVPKGMGVIVRTAGAKRTKVEIKRDYDYLSRLWETIRNTTLESIAPALIHEEGNLVKRSIRDLYNKDIDEILVQGEDAYKAAKSFIKMLMPSHAKNVKQYKDDIPLFLRYQVERQIEAGHDAIVQLRSGGYLVIHPTEALVAVDVNSGRATKESNVESTALKTNLEAAEEVARQMRLRDLAGLVVIDFIDMEENKHNRAVERKMKENLARDRARVQMAKISQFGLMEISRQRRRRSLLEGSTIDCVNCGGIGRKRTIESSALYAIRAVEEVAVRGQVKRIRLSVAPDVSLYIFNEKRALLQNVEEQFNVFTELTGDDALLRPEYKIDVIENNPDAKEDPLKAYEKEARANRKASGSRRRKKGRGNDNQSNVDENGSVHEGSDTQDTDGQDTHNQDKEPKRRRRSRGRRGNRGRDRQGTDTQNPSSLATEDETSGSDKNQSRRRKSRGKKSEDQSQTDQDVNAVETEKADVVKSTSRRKAPSRRSASKPDSETSAKSDQKKAPRKTRARAAGKKDADDKSAGVDSQSKDSDAGKARKSSEGTKTDPRSTSRRAAPKRKASKTSDQKTSDKKVSDKKASGEEKKAKSEKASAKGKTSHSTARRKAPSKKTSPQETSKTEAVGKTAASQKAPTKKAPAKKSSVAKKKPAPKKVAPRKAAPKKAVKKTAETDAQAPTRKAKAKTEPSASSAGGQGSADAQNDTPQMGKADKAKKDKKRRFGWLKREKKTD